MTAGTEVRQDLLSATAEIERLAAAHQQEALRSAATELARRIEQDCFHLVVVGQFKRGKTTFLNRQTSQPRRGAQGRRVV